MHTGKQPFKIAQMLFQTAAHRVTPLQKHIAMRYRTLLYISATIIMDGLENRYLYGKTRNIIAATVQPLKFAKRIGQNG